MNHVVENKCRFYQRGTALKMASDRGCSLTVKLLLESGANPNLTGMLQGNLTFKAVRVLHKHKLNLLIFPASPGSLTLTQGHV